MIDSITRGYYLEMGLLMVLLSTVGKIFHSFLINHSSIFNTNNFNSSLRAYNYKQRRHTAAFYVNYQVLHCMQCNEKVFEYLFRTSIYSGVDII